MADGEAIILEWRVNVGDEDAEVAFAYDPRPNVKRKALNKESNLPEEL